MGRSKLQTNSISVSEAMTNKMMKEKTAEAKRKVKMVMKNMQEAMNKKMKEAAAEMKKICEKQMQSAKEEREKMRREEEKRRKHREYVQEVCDNQGIPIEIINVEASCPPGENTIYFRPREDW